MFNTVWRLHSLDDCVFLFKKKKGANNNNNLFANNEKASLQIWQRKEVAIKPKKTLVA